MNKSFVGSNCYLCLKYKTNECDGRVIDCKSFDPAEFRNPIFYNLIDNCPLELAKLLTHFEMEVIETNRYPYFMLVI